MAVNTPEDKEQKERLRRMKQMAENLFEEELKPKKHSNIKHRGPLILACFMITLLLLVAILHRVNRFIDLNEKVTASAGRLEVSFQRRANLFKNIVNATLNQATLEFELVKHVADSRSGVTPTTGEGQAQNSLEKLEQLAPALKDKKVFEALKSALEGEASLPKLNALVEQYPQIQFSGNYALLIQNLMDIEDNIIIRRDAQNDAVRRYNTAIAEFPWIIIAKATGYHKYPYFKVLSDKIHKGPIIDAEMYKRLLPEVKQPPLIKLKE